jgi:hypothetical protein
MYNQRYTGSIYQFAIQFNASARYNYRFLTTRWERHFGRDSIVIRPYGTALVERDVRRDFLSLLDPDLVDLVDQGYDEVKDNISLSATAMPYLSRINCLALTPLEHNQVMAALAAAIPADKKARLLDSDEAADFYARFRRDNRYVFERYLGAEEDQFESLEKPAQQQVHVSHEDFDLELLLEILQREQLALPMVSLLRQRTAG